MGFLFTDHANQKLFVREDSCEMYKVFKGTRQAIFCPLDLLNLFSVCHVLVTVTVVVRACSHCTKFSLFCKRICQRETNFSANDFFDPPKFSQEPPNYKDAVNYFWMPTMFCRARKSIVPWQIPFNWSSYLVIERRVSELWNDCLPILKLCTEKGFRKLRFQTRILQVDWGLDVYWATELKSPWLVKAETFPTKPKVIVHWPQSVFAWQANSKERRLKHLAGAFCFAICPWPEKT